MGGGGGGRQVMSCVCVSVVFTVKQRVVGVAALLLVECALQVVCTG